MPWRRDNLGRLEQSPAAHDEPALVQQSLEAGALGYVLQVAAGEELVPAVRAAQLGECYGSPGQRRVAP